MTSRDISDLLADFFGEKISKSSVNNLAKSFHDIRQAWAKSSLEKTYKVIYCDAIYITVRRDDSYAKEAVYIAYGVREDNTRELLILESSPTESAAIWGEYFNQLKSRGGGTGELNSC
jgi:transposase-like protein